MSAYWEQSMVPPYLPFYLSAFFFHLVSFKLLDNHLWFQEANADFIFLI